MIDDFCNSFTAEIRQIIVNNRMKIMCTEKKFIKTITHHDIKILKKEELKTTDEILKTMIRNVLMQTKKNSDNFVCFCTFRVSYSINILCTVERKTGFL